MISTSTLQLCIPFVILVAYWAWKRRRSLTLLKRHGIPGPKADFFFGNMLHVQNKNVIAINKWIKEYGKVIGIFEVGPTVVIADADLARQIQIKDFPLFPHRRILLDEGGFDANPKYEVSIIAHEISPQRWKEQRALITSAFTSSKIRASVPLVREGLDVLMENIQSEAGKGDFDIYDLFQRLTMDTIGRSAFGTNLNVQRDPGNKFFQATRRVFDNASKSWTLMLTFVTMVFPEFFHILYPIRKLQRVFLQTIGRPSHFTYQLQMCVDIIEKRKRENERGGEAPDDFLQRLIDASLTTEQMRSLTEASLAASDDTDQVMEQVSHRRSGRVHRMNDQEVAANASIMFDAGYETTSTFLAFLFHVLVNRQDIQQEVRQEVLLLKERDGDLGYNTCHSLPYLDALMYETLRYFPPVTAFVSRQSTTDYKYKDMTIPANVAIEIAVSALHHDPELWAEPETFDPMRFYRDNKWRAQSVGFQAFGAGPRNCLGMRFALMEAKLTVARILSEYHILPGPRTEPFYDLDMEYKPITQNPKNGIFVTAVKL